VYFVIYIEFFLYCLFVSNSQVIGCEDRLWNELYCVGWGVKLYSINQSMLFADINYSPHQRGRKDPNRPLV